MADQREVMARLATGRASSRSIAGWVLVAATGGAGKDVTRLKRSVPHSGALQKA